MRLTKIQQRALGCRTRTPADLPNWCWNEQLSQIYKPCPSCNKQLEDEGQTFPEFKAMEKYPPNQQGTGRLKFRQVTGFDLIIIEQNKRLKARTINVICEVLSAFLGIKTTFRERKWKVSPQGIIDRLNQQEFTLRTDDLLEVHPLLSLLIEFKTPERNTVALIEHPLCEEGSELEGRACGDGVAAISYDSKTVEQHRKLQDLIETVIHECLHTLGFDHCLAWGCVMNGIVGEEVWPCPACMLKLHSELQIEVVEWYKKLLEVYRKHKLRRFVRKGDLLLRAISTEE